MMHPLVTQLHFTRSEFVRCFKGTSPEDGCRRPEPMNCLSWIVGHLACQEHIFWVQLAQGRNIAPDLQERVGFGRPSSTPPYDEMWSLWHDITRAADVYVDKLKPEDLKTRFVWEGKRMEDDVGKLLLRNIYHYWFHIGKAHSTRQMLGHMDLPAFVGNMTTVMWALEE